MSIPQPHEQSPNPTSPIDNLATQVVNRRMVAEVRIAKASTQFIDEPNFNARDSLLPEPFIGAVKAYLASPAIVFPANWPPRTWASRYGLQEAIETFRFPNDTDTQVALEADSVFNAIEDGLTIVSRLTPSNRPDVQDWRSLAKACHRLRTDDLTLLGIEGVERGDQVQDPAWREIIVKLQDSRPDGV